MQEIRAAGPVDTAADDFWVDFEFRILDVYLEELIVLAPKRLAHLLIQGRIWTYSFFTSL